MNALEEAGLRVRRAWWRREGVEKRGVGIVMW